MTRPVSDGTTVRIVQTSHGPHIENLVGREGVTERPESDGCYVRFADGTYVFAWYEELEPVGHVNDGADYDTWEMATGAEETA